MHAKLRVDAINLFVLSVLILCLLSFVFLLLIGSADLFAWNVFRNVSGKYLLPLYLLVIGLVQIYNFYANRIERYGFIAKMSITQSVVQAGTRIVLGLSDVHRLGLIYGAIMGALASVCWGVKLHLIHYVKRCFSWNKCKELAVEYKKMPLYDLPAKLVNKASVNIPVLLLAYYFTKEDVGYFSMSITLLFLPMSFIGSAIGQVFYKKACVCNDEQIARLGRNIFKFTFIIGLVPIILLVCWDEALFEFFLGKGWGIAGTYSLYLCLWVWCLFCFFALEPIFIVKNRQRLGMLLNMVMFVLRIMAVIAGGYYLNSIRWTVLLYGLVGLGLWCFEGFYIWRLLKIKMNRQELISGIGILVVVLSVWSLKVMNNF